MRRSPPSSIQILPSHIPTPPRGAPKYHLPSIPCPAIIEPAKTLRDRSASDASTNTADSSTLAVDSSPSCTQVSNNLPPWVTSRTIEMALSKMRAEDVLPARPADAVVMSR